MSDKYNPQDIESKWQQKWEADQLYRSKVDWSKPKHYALTMLPYPSGDLHIGHWFAMTPSDARARFMRMQGYNVLFPMGFDAFGLPAEQAAISRGIHPAKWTYANIERMRGQMRSMGNMFDWEREAISSDPQYYKWTEWFFGQFYKNDLAYRGEAMVNWSDALQTVLANEQVIDGKDERLGQPVIQKKMTQWFFRYTRYAEEMLDFGGIDWPEPIKIMQTNWIGKSEGAHVTFKTESGESIQVYTTRPDTLWGATFMVLAPEHPLVEKITTGAQLSAVEDYIKQAAKATEIERQSDTREKSGVFTGAYAINPVNGERIPIWIADYVLITYGSGAIMAVPYGDQRDFEFARKYGLIIVAVVQPEGADSIPNTDEMTEAYAGPGVMVNSGPIDGTIHNGMKGRKSPAIAAAIDYLEQQGIGKGAVNYRLRDWLISRQRYWGSPIPMIFREDGGVEPVREDQLPVELPTDVQITGVGNPLKQHASFVNTFDSDENPATRETDTMDTFMCSSWYWYRYLSPSYSASPFDAEEAAYWLPVDTYTGGAEHATMHLLYARWFAKAMRDLGMFDEAARIAKAHGKDIGDLGEPMLQLRNQGQILGEERPGHTIMATGTTKQGKLFANKVEVIATGAASVNDTTVMGEIMKRVENVLHVNVGGGELKVVEVLPDAEIKIPDVPGPNNVNQLKHHLEIQRMSKSKGNVINPDELVAKYGADVVRAYLMFGFEWSQGGPWNSKNIQGVVRWLNEVWDMVTAGAPTVHGDVSVERGVERAVHQAIANVARSITDFSFNTAVAELMKLKNSLRDAIKTGKVSGAVWNEAIQTMLLLMAPITPHVAEELWARIGGAYSIHQQAFPTYDPAKAASEETVLVVQIGSKVVARIDVPVDISEEEAKRLALESEGARKMLNGSSAKKVIFIPGRVTPGRPPEPKVNIVI
jgi:leucyl-tRNA synthetase